MSKNDFGYNEALERLYNTNSTVFDTGITRKEAYEYLKELIDKANQVKDKAYQRGWLDGWNSFLQIEDAIHKQMIENEYKMLDELNDNYHSSIPIVDIIYKSPHDIEVTNSDLSKFITYLNTITKDDFNGK